MVSNDGCHLVGYKPNKTQGWRRSVDARHFVMELRDHYAENPTDLPADPNHWALRHITLGRVGSILEAFDDDASGFVTVNEVNRLTQSRPRDWRCAPFAKRARLTCLSVL